MVEKDNKIAEETPVIQEQNSSADLSKESEVKEASENTPENQQQINWKRFREERAKERKQKEEAERRAAQKEEEARALKEAMEALLNKPVAQSREHEREDDSPSEEEIIERKVQAALEKREKQLAEERRIREAQELPNRLASNYKDFNTVCTEDNLDYLEFHYPEVAAAFKHMPDSFDKWANIYQAVKRFVPNGSNSNKDQAKATKNLSKPQSMSVGGMTATGDMAPHMLTEQKKQDNWARMQARIKGIA